MAARELSSMLLRLAVSRRGFRSFVVFATGGVVFVELLGAVRTFEFMTFANSRRIPAKLGIDHVG